MAYFFAVNGGTLPPSSRTSYAIVFEQNLQVILYHLFINAGKPEITVQKPANFEINTTTTEIVIAESDQTFEVVCTGQFHLIWYYPDNAFAKITEQTTAELNPTTDTGLLFKSVLTVTNISASETGEYSCIMVRYVSTAEEEKLTRAVYVYITSTGMNCAIRPKKKRIVVLPSSGIFEYLGRSVRKKI